MYVDEMVVKCKSLEAYPQHLKVMLDQFRGVGLKLKKCFFGALEVAVLGYFVSGTEVRMDPRKIEAILEADQPK